MKRRLQNEENKDSDLFYYILFSQACRTNIVIGWRGDSIHCGELPNMMASHQLLRDYLEIQQMNVVNGNEYQYLRSLKLSHMEHQGRYTDKGRSEEKRAFWSNQMVCIRATYAMSGSVDHSDIIVYQVIQV